VPGRLRQIVVATLRTASAKAGVPLYQFIEPIALSTPKNLLAQLAMATKPVQATIDRVRALIAGEPIPPPRESPFRGHYGKRERPHDHSRDRHITEDVLMYRRSLAERAHAERMPGETVHQALRRIQAGERE